MEGKNFDHHIRKISYNKYDFRFFSFVCVHGYFIFFRGRGGLMLCFFIFVCWGGGGGWGFFGGIFKFCVYLPIRSMCLRHCLHVCIYKQIDAKLDVSALSGANLKQLPHTG